MKSSSVFLRSTVSGEAAGSIQFRYDRGFTLLEVMIAIAIIAIAFSSLFGSQSVSLSLATEAKFNSTASFLAQEKLAELESGISGFNDDEGDFGEEFPDFSWKIEARDGDFGEIEALDELERPVIRLDLTISWQGELFSTTFTSYGREKIE